MRKIILHIIYFSCFIVVGQSTNDDYDIFSKTIDFGVASFDTDIEFYNFGDSRMKPFKIAVVIEKLEYEFKEDHLLLKNIKNADNKDFNKTLKWMVGDSIKIKRYKTNQDILDVLPDLDSTFINHTEINTDSLNLKTIEPQSLSNELFNDLLDNSTSSYDRRWRKINRKFKHSIALGLSKIKYVGNYASLYYWVDCGKFGLCKSEHVIVFEKIDGEWKILNDIYLWISP
ncbi:hypothetical protein [Winogradskyella sp. PC D3.3]